MFYKGACTRECCLPHHENFKTHANFSFVSKTNKQNHMAFSIRRISATACNHFPSANSQRIIMEDSESELECDEPRYYAELEATKAGEKPRVVVLGTGWAACRFLKGLDTKTYDVVCISPRNHMVFTPLLASTCVGTLEFRSVAEPISRIQSALTRNPNSFFFLASCTSIDTDQHVVSEFLLPLQALFSIFCFLLNCKI